MSHNLYFFNKDKDNKTFGEHLDDFRKHLIRIIIAIVALSTTAFIYKGIIFDKIIFAPKNPDFITYRILCFIGQKLHLPDICIQNFNFSLINIDIAGQFTTHIWVSFISGVVLSFPFIIWELSRFIKPALYENELKYVKVFITFTSLLFFTGVIFGYYVISPMAVNFLGTYQVSSQVTNTINLDSYITMVTSSTFLTGVLFELPLFSYILTKIGILTPHFMKKYRKHAVVVIIIVAAIITPSTDFFTLMLVSVPLYLLYEVSIVISAKIVKVRD